MKDELKTKKQLINELAKLRKRLSKLEASEINRKSEERLLFHKEIIENMAEGVHLIRRSDNVIVYANPKIEEMFGYSQGELAGKHVIVLNAPTDKSPEEKADEIGNALERNGRWDGEILNIRKDGTPFWCSAVVSAFKSHEYGEVWISIHQDITERKRAEEEIQKLNEELEQRVLERTAELEEANRKLKKSKAKYKDIFSNVAVSILEEDISEVKKAIDDLNGQGIRDFKRYLDENPDFVRRAVQMVKIIDANDTALRLYGAKSKSELITSLDKIFTPASFEVFKQELIAIAEGRRYFEAEDINMNLQGEPMNIWLHVTLPSEKSGSGRRLTTIIDITDLKRIESRLSLQYDITSILSESKGINETMEKILQVVCERNGWEIGEIWFIDEKTDTLRLNSLWHQPSLDITEFEAISKETTFKKGEGLPGRVWENGHPEWIMDVAGNKDFLRESIASKTGIHCAFAFPIKSSGRVLGIFTFFSRKIELRDNDFLQMLDALGSQIGDFIERKHAEEELKRYSEELEKRVKERTKDLEEAKVFAEIANRVKSDFLMNMSHELKTPLNSIIGFSEIMIDGILGDMTDQQRGNLKNIYESGKHLFSLINDILEISRIDAGLTEIESNKFSLRKSCESIMEKFRDKSIKRNIELKVEIEEELTDIIADERKIKYVVFNFLDNAIKFTPDGGSVLLKARQISDFGLRISELKEAGKIFLTENGKFSFTIPQSAIEIAAEDTGIGISPEDQKRLFQPFHQLEPTLTKRYPGIGLGLYLSKRCIELQSGVIWVESETGKGSRFNFVIPIKY